MSSAFDCCLPCPPGAIPSASVINVPGLQGDQGDPGTDGADGANGKNAFSTSAALGGTLLPIQGNTVSVLCDDVAWMQVGQNVIMSGTDSATSNPAVANFVVVSKNTATNTCVLEFLEYTGDLATGNTILTGAGISPAGVQVQPVIPPAALYTLRFVSSEYAIATGTIIDVAHGLGGYPDSVRAALICQTSEFGYLNAAGGGAAGADQIDLGTAWNNQTLFTYGATFTNVWLNFAANDPTITVNRKDTSVENTVLTKANWKVKLTAIKLDVP